MTSLVWDLHDKNDSDVDSLSVDWPGGDITESEEEQIPDLQPFKNNYNDTMSQIFNQNSVQRIDNALAIYYQQMKRNDYYNNNDNKKGAFAMEFEKNKCNINEIEKELQTYLKFNMFKRFPIKKGQYELLQYCYQYGTPPYPQNQNNSKLVLLINGYIRYVINYELQMINIEQRILLFMDTDVMNLTQQYFYLQLIDGIIQKCSQQNKELDIFGAISNIIPDFLWLGDEENASDIDLLNRLGITYVLNCAAYDAIKTIYPSNFIVHFVFASDNDKYKLIERDIDHCIQFIVKCKRNGGRILIHCVAGMNRSPTVVVAYLMYLMGMDILNAVKYTTKRRIHILGNKTFKIQLINYAAKIQKLSPMVKTQDLMSINMTTNNF